MSPVGAGSSLAYGDDFDIMGAVTISTDRSSFHVNTHKKAGMGWIPASDVTTAAASTSYRVFQVCLALVRCNATPRRLREPVHAQHDAESANFGNRAVKVLRTGSTYYWIEYRLGACAVGHRCAAR